MNFRRSILLLVCSLAASWNAFAFSLIGPYKSWQTADIGYQYNGENGGPMLPSEGYRWNTPTIFYAFDRAFIEYFGPQGVAAVEAAIKILNDLPSADSLSADLGEYPLNTKQVNHSLSTAGLFDVKSIALTYILEEMGLASPEAYVWTMRGRNTSLSRTNYSVVKLNFDPVTLRPSSYVNGSLYTYEVFEGALIGGGSASIAAEIKVADLRTIGFSSVAGGGGNGADSVVSVETDPNTGDLLPASPELGAGEYYLGLTRDDVGGLRRLYSRNTLAVEDLSLDTVASSGSSGGGPWGIPVVITNGVALTNNFLALRPGRGKITFTRVLYDSLVGNTFTPFRYNYTDSYVQGGVLRTRTATRIITRPDFLFSAGDVGINPITSNPYLVRRTTTTAWRSFASINRDTSFNTPDLTADGGPGLIEGPISITFNSILPAYLNRPGQNGESDAFFYGWGSFDGSSDLPTIYPVYGQVNLALLNSLAIGSSSATPWEIAPSLFISTNSTGQVTAGTGGAQNP